MEKSSLRDGYSKESPSRGRVDVRPVSLANGIVNRSIIGSVYLAELLIFFGAQMLFTAFLRLPPLPVFALVAVAIAVRAIEILYADRTLKKDKTRSRQFAVLSIAWTFSSPC